ncbi:MAG: MBL fold metallo-hydrolase [Bacillota bacterium]
MKIKWFGHACFLITSESGIKIVTDPFDSTVGYKVHELEADIVSTSHDHFDHNNIDAVKAAMHVKGSGKINIKGIEITGVATFHDEYEGEKRGRNTVFKFRVDGLNICHLGDLGHILTRDQLREIGDVDVLLVPVGGTYTIDFRGAVEVMKLIKPVVTIPMHFKTPALKFDIDGVDKFLSAAGGGERIGKQKIELHKDSINKVPGIIVLDYE